MTTLQLDNGLIWLANMGWRMFPGARASRAACFKAAREKSSSNDKQLAEWAQQYPGCGWRLALGASGLWALDVDVPSPDHAHDGVASLRALVAEHGSLPPRPTIRTGGGGYALIWRANGVEISTKHPAPGLDPLRGDNELALPPSLHHRTRQPYRWIVPPWEVAPPDAPGWLLDLVREPPPRTYPPRSRTRPMRQEWLDKALDAACREVERAPQGERNRILNRQAYRMAKLIRSSGLSPSDVVEELARSATRAGLTRKEIEGTIKSGMTAGAGVRS